LFPKLNSECIKKIENPRLFIPIYFNKQRQFDDTNWLTLPYVNQIHSNKYQGNMNTKEDPLRMWLVFVFHITY
jgi:hypothetical protein